jgi:hypothetical protein
MKKEFMLNEIWMLTIGASFQRANVYSTECLDSDKLKFRNHLKDFIINLSKSYLHEPISEDQHIENIYQIREHSKIYKTILTNGELNFGVCQKLLNLYLKYLWCLGYMELNPPHFPVDRIIQTKLSIKNPYSWTQMVDEEKYMEVISMAKDCLKSYNIDSIAELELFLYQRR